MNGLTYTKVGDYYLPNLVLKEQPDSIPICWRLTRLPMSEWIFLCSS